MRPATVFWATVLVAALLFEGSALWRRVYEDTLTYHAKLVMLWSPWLAWLIPTLIVGLAIHLMIEYSR